jgi:anthranilate synthase component 2
MRILLIDAFDSFIYIIHQYLLAAGAQSDVVRSDEIRCAEIAAMAPEALVLGPGPGHPADSGHVEIVRRYASEIPIFGVCLGHQAVGLAFGAAVRPATHLMHGKTSQIAHDGQGIFRGVPDRFLASRYHSLIVTADTVPDELVISARAVDDGYVMALRHRWLRVESVQFHPESIGTEHGLELLRGFLDQCSRGAAGRA